MWAFFKIAWRDLWRHKLRTSLTLGAITFGSAITLFVMSWQNGKRETLIRTAISYFPGYLQVHRAGFQDDQTLARAMPLKPELVRYLDQSRLVSGYSPRLCTEALVQAGNNMAGAQICGVAPEKEVKVSRVAQTFFPQMIKTPKGIKANRRFRGAFLESGSRGEAALGEDLAKNLQVNVGDQISLLGQDYYGSMASGNFRVKGIFHSGSPEYDRSLMLVDLEEMQNLLAMTGQVTAVTVNVKDRAQIPALENDIYAILSNDPGPWKLEQLAGPGIWLVKPMKPSLEPDSPLQLASEPILKDSLKRIPGLKGFSLQLRSQLMLKDQKLAVLGVDPERENEVARVFPAMPSGKDWAFLSPSLMSRQGLKAGDQIMLSGVNYLDENIELKLKVAGSFVPNQSSPDAYVPLPSLQEKLGMGENVNQATLRLPSRIGPDQARKLIQSRLNYEVIPWQELVPEMVQMAALGDAANVLMTSILMVVIAFVFLLTILMSVLDRAREFGIMKAIGTRPSEIFTIILIESFMLGLLGTLIGIVVGGIPSLYFTFIPLDMTSFSTSMEHFGFDPFMYAKLEPRMLLYTIAINFVIVLLVTLPPAVRAARTKPMQSLRLQ